MILRRVIKHVRNQEWTAVFLDFLIVVMGILLAFQITNWSAAQSDKAEYVRALDRLNVEIEANLAALDDLDAHSERSLKITKNAFDVLQTCIESEENQKVVSAGLLNIMGTLGVHLRRNALADLTTNSRLLAQQSTQERQRFTDLSFYFDLLLREARYVEELPMDARIQDNPIIGISGWKDGGVKYFGVDFSRSSRQLVLNVPIDEACKNNQLIKSFYTWERWQKVIPVLSRQLRKELVATQNQFQLRFEETSQ